MEKEGEREQRWGKWKSQCISSGRGVVGRESKCLP